MASIINLSTQEIVLLSTQHVFGRNPQQTNTFHAAPDVSKSHATVYWQGGNWFFRDHSRNGTLLEGEHLHQSTRKLTKDQWFQLSRNEDTRWQILDLDPPCSYIRSLKEDKSIVKLSSCHVLPDEDNPEVILYHGSDKRWLIEVNDSISDLEHGAKIVVGDDRWIFVYNEIIDDTIDLGNTIKDAFFLFKLSQDEEHVNLQLVVSPELTIDLGTRSHNYILLALARRRIEDMLIGSAFEEQGWVYIDDLLRDLSKELQKDIDVYYLNLQIYRLRKQLSELPSYGYLFSNIIQRRTGLIRFAHPYMKIVKDEVCTGELLPV